VENNMFDDPKELLAKIRLGEDSVLELKEVVFSGNKIKAPHRDALADELASFANSKGGICVLGVRDRDREVVGIPVDRLDRVEAFVSEICNDSVEPPLVAHIERVLLPAAAGGEVPVVKIDVPRSLFVHQSPGGYLIRLGSSKRKVGPEWLARLFQQRSQSRLVRFDETPVAGATLTDLVPALWSRFRMLRTRDPDEEFLVKLGIARVDDAGALRPTVAGVLIASADPRRWLPDAFVQAVAYRGTSSAPEGPRDVYQVDAKDIGGPLDEQIIEACRFVYRNMRIAATKAMGRQDLPQFDMAAVFEALVNAVAHRDYSFRGSKVRLRLYADRLELHSPGGLANTMTVDMLPLRQAVRNETIAALLSRIHVPADIEWLGTDRLTFMDRRGEGVRVILENSERLSGRVPEYRLLDDAELMLTIFAANPADTGQP
jgi:predicted HTH transcriptional regulator